MNVIKNIPLEFHPQAFVDENNVVVTIAAFAEDATQEDFDGVFEQQKQLYPSIVKMISCCDFGEASKGWVFTGVTFQPPKPFPSWIWEENEWGRGYWKAPISFPQNDKISFVWDENSQIWKELD